MSDPDPNNPWDTGGELAPAVQEGGGWDIVLPGGIVPDISALLPPDEWVNWGPTIESIDPIYVDVLDSWLKSARDADIPLAAIMHALACVKGMTFGDAIEVLETLFNYAGGEDRIEMADPCQIRRMAKVGNCFARRYYGITFGPDLQDFWLDGKAGNSAYLKQETFQFPPDGRGTPTIIAYYPIDTVWFFGRIGTKIEPGIVEGQVTNLWQGILDRLRAPVDKAFPEDKGVSSQKDLSPLREQVSVGTGASTLHTTGTDWIYPGEFSAVFKHAWQNPNEKKREYADDELFLAGGMAITSEVEVQAMRSTLQIGSETVEGWMVTIVAWRLRVSDRIDYNPGDTQLIPLGPLALELPDQLFLDLQSQGCPGEPTPVDFDVITDAWHTLAPSHLKHTVVFIPLETYRAPRVTEFDSEPTPYDFFDPVSGEGVRQSEI